MDTTKQSENYEGLLWRNCPRTEKTTALCQERNGSKPHPAPFSPMNYAGVLSFEVLFSQGIASPFCPSRCRFSQRNWGCVNAARYHSSTTIVHDKCAVL
ncbi:hypothetical protein T4D_7805 [Trichinella pseudospiralis]|uniref:Uncharacterized protein n=1 Tax=Trichinella pseudospiralis TaxID=6337 RepID=A0A0V1F6S0_TRIPS|nr:hypothetical protein T4D_7805 [Trichinella pseudospiralis]